MTDARKVRRLRRVEASNYLLETWGMSRTPKTLSKLAVIGGGPRFRRDGRIPLYETAALDEWARAQLSKSVHSTAELRTTTEVRLRSARSMSSALT